MRQLTREVTLGTWRFEVTKMSAQTASWLSNLLVANSLTNGPRSQPQATPEAATPETTLTPEEQAAGAVGTLWLLCGSTLDEERYKRVQQCALASCRILDPDGNPSAVVMQDGRFTSKDLESDAPTVNKLIAEALTFNLACFFAAGSSAPAPTPSASTQPSQ